MLDKIAARAQGASGYTELRVSRCPCARAPLWQTPARKAGAFPQGFIATRVLALRRFPVTMTTRSRQSWRRPQTMLGSFGRLPNRVSSPFPLPAKASTIIAANVRRCRWPNASACCGNSMPLSKPDIQV